MGLRVLTRERAVIRKERQPPRAALLANRQRVPHQIALTNDANDASLRGDDWNTTDALGVQDFGNLWDRGLGCNRDDLARHDIGSSQQGNTSLPVHGTLTRIISA